MKRYFIKLAYNGTNYHGWQIQNNAHTVQAEINDKLSKLLGKKINVVGCGRTDTGVHAREFYAHFDFIDQKIPLAELTYKLDQFLPPDVTIYKIFEVAPDFHARFNALSRTYSYYISCHKNPFLIDQSFLYQGHLDHAEMEGSCKYLFDYEDFTSFSKLHTQTTTNKCKIMAAHWKSVDGTIIFTIKADRFLRNMVRAIVGTMIEIGKGKLKMEDMKKIIESQDRSRAGFSVPAQGLFLEHVEYDFDD